MRVKYLGSGSGEGGSPTLFATDRGTILVQGYIVTDPQALSDIGEIPEGETVVEITQDILRFADEPLTTDPRNNRQRATSTEGQEAL
ncbi:hypothetical protein [Nonomuraea rubra]|uniref:Uncharacterized protein n=1 Tax=Nonomuraea rubra TaxID=46180 RepID=A0A7X0P8B6_9ACTN|nr:hypothetical protein [Nonomuraea rubra]MBB6557096.1 hypothetical protein [Nonomuraea rubra]